MGDVTVVAFAVLALAGAILLGWGAAAKVRTLKVAGAAILLGLAGAWVFGLLGIAVGLVAFVFLKPKPHTEPS